MTLRTPPTEATFFRDLFGDLTLRIEWLEQVIDGVPDSGASTHLRGWAKALVRHGCHIAVPLRWRFDRNPQVGMDDPGAKFDG